MTKSHLTDRATLRAARRRLGFTMLEIMTSVTLALMLMYAVARIFSRVGGAMNETTSIMQMTNSLRNTKNRLTTDLESLTLIPQPPANSQLGQGYLCYVEGLGGPLSRVSASGGALAPYSTADFALDAERLAAYGSGDSADYVDTTVGDLDDIISFTAKAPTGQPFKGRYLRPTLDVNGNVDVVPDLFESEFAEIVWFVRGTTLYRRVLPIMDDKTLQDSLNAFEQAVANGGAICDKLTEGTAKNFSVGLVRMGYAFFRFYDVSVHTEYAWTQANNGASVALGYVHANTLGDLSNRANRYGYWNSFGLSVNPYCPTNLPKAQAPKLYSQFSLHGLYNGPESWYWLRMPTLQESSSWTFRAGYPFGDTRYGKSDPSFENLTWFNGYRWEGVEQELNYEQTNDNPHVIDVGLYSSSDLPAVRSNNDVAPQPFVDYWNNPNFWQEVDPETGDLYDAVYSTTEVFNNDVVLTNVLSFNVKAWDPRTNAYVDLGSGVANGDSFRDDPNDLRSAGRYSYDESYNFNNDARITSAVPAWTRMPCVYDTWTEEYQSDFYSYCDENGVYNIRSVSQGSDFFALAGTEADIPANSSVPSSVLPNYPPPYDVPLKGLQIEIRVFDPRSRTIRNSTFNVDLMKR